MSRRRLPLWAGWLLALAVACACAALGLWQLQRMHAKQALLEASAQVLDERRAQPLEWAADPSRTRAYDWAAGEGRFLPLPAVLLDNQNRDGRAGVRAYRVFQPSAAGATPLLLELGWLPLPGDRRLPDVPVPDATQVSGLLLPPPSSGLVTPAIAAQADGTLLVVALEPQSLATALNLSTLAPRVLRLDPALSLGYARDLELLPNTLPPERHLGYAVQWFALAAAVLVIALLLTVRERRRR
ncbi:SURF1 family protein [Pseudoxanthomonas daejeonensis]|uniref:SURF1 family protein n=1 Tax=Pseudoxanthomonas daejeonensis TaxID=266062 RepID=UPI001F546090|nr:SURF1 family protein [Pseudoxanthomonas daejeonensis]UNK58536.1 SURF1 family protein [Pseudoxanthomonas daejeonensis]